MLAQQVNPDDEIYRPLQEAAEHFNRALYEGQLPAHVFTLQRAKRTAGFFSPLRWRHGDGREVSEIALNPTIFSGRPLWRLFQTIVREQCHLWQHTYGKPTRLGYHNTEWANKMEKLGLVPSKTGRPGGRRTGQTLETYPLPGGAFALACADLILTGLQFPWVDTEAVGDDAAEPFPEEGVDASVARVLNAPFSAQQIRPLIDTGLLKKKVNYRCPMCGTNVWGKPGINLICAPCDVNYLPIT